MAKKIETLSRIIIQQDNANSYLKYKSYNDPHLLEEEINGNWKIQLKSQPPNSPDFNALDLELNAVISHHESLNIIYRSNKHFF